MHLADASIQSNIFLSVYIYINIIYGTYVFYIYK